MQLELMIEGQEDVTWAEWVALARACEQHGVGTLFRSDHYLSVMGHEQRGSLETWTTLAGLAAITTRLRFGVLVSPVTFRHPSVLAKAVAAVDHISGGRVDFGLGAGWNEREHEAYGFEFPPLGTRLEMLEEQLEVVCGAWADGPFSFSGAHYNLVAVDALPKPLQRPHPPILVGGSGPTVFDRVLAFGDAWFPNHSRGGALDRAAELMARADRPIDLMVMGIPADPRVLEAYEQAGFRRAVHWLPSAGRGPVERALDRYETAIAELHGE
jgi:alkanesulfonate monooxygenase SsuD/methylene tetrahydromethanopterin reductase-like flavin-dependent oxidoreductase (luciferase family)